MNWSYRENDPIGPLPFFSTHERTPAAPAPAQPPLGKQGASDVRQSWRRRKQLRLRFARWRRGERVDGWSEGGREERNEASDGGREPVLSNLPLLLSALTAKRDNRSWKLWTVWQWSPFLRTQGIYAVCGSCCTFICLSVCLFLYTYICQSQLLIVSFPVCFFFICTI